MARKGVAGKGLRLRPRSDRSRRRSPALLFSPVCAVLMMMFWDGSVVDRQYAVSRSAAAAGAVTILGPFVAACAAWEVLVLRRVWGRLTIGRSWVAVLVHRLTSTLLVAGGLEILLFLRASTSAGGIAWPDGEFVALLSLGIVSWTFFGAALGLWLPPLIAVVGALLLPFLFLVMPFGWQPLWLRHLTGVPLDCCSTSDVFDVRVFMGSFLVLVSLFLLTIAAIAVRLGPYRAPFLAPVVVCLVASICLVAAVRSVDVLGPLPVSSRDASELHCENEVCLWPEDQEFLNVNQEVWESVRMAWIGMGLPEPVRRIAPIETSRTLPIVSRSTDRSQVTTSMVTLLPRAVFHCTNHYADERRNHQISQLTNLLAGALGLPSPDGTSQADGTRMTDPGLALRTYRAVRPC